MLDHQQQMAPVLRNARADPLAGAVAAEHVDVARRRRADGVITDADPRPAILQRVVQAAAVRLERHSSIQSALQHIGEIRARLDVAETQLGLVLATPAHAVGQKGSVLRDVFDTDVARVIRAQRVRIQEDLVAAVPPLTHVEDREVVLHATLQHEIPSAASNRRPLDVVAGQRREALTDGPTPRQAREQGARVNVLRVDPGSGLGAFPVLEPAVRVDDRYAVDHLSHVVLPRGRWRPRLASGDGACRHEHREGGVLHRIPAASGRASTPAFSSSTMKPSAGTSSRRCEVPDGQRTVSDFTLVSGPRPKCARRSLCER